MKATRVVNLLFQLDALHKRIDFQRLTAHILFIVIAAGWAAADSEHFWSRFAASLVVGFIIRLLLSRLGASRVATLLIVTTLFALGRHLSSSEAWLVAVYAFVVLVAQEYFLLRTKLMALVAAIVAALVIAGTGQHARELLLLFSVVMVARLLWHAVLERMSKRAFVLFAIKSVGIAVVTPIIYLAFKKWWGYSFDLPSALPALHVSIWLKVVVVLLAIRGLWATILLKTARSPQCRLLRLFYIFFGLAALVAVVFVHRYGGRIFLPSALQTLGTFGLTAFGITSVIYALLALSLLASAGIDRTLYKDTAFARSLRRFISARTPTEQMSSDKQD